MRRPFSVIAAISLVLLAAAPAAAAKPEIDPSWANGKLVAMIGPHITTTPSAGLYNRAEELYLIVYPINPDGQTDLGALTLPSGYQPNCDPCFHPGLPLEFGYHDHVLTGAPGMGNHGTAGVYVAPWKIIVMMYNPDKFLSPDFVPLKSEAQVDWGEENGYFLPISQGDNAYEMDTGWVLICPVTSWHA